MTSKALGQSFLLEMALIFGDRRMACQAIGEAQERPGYAAYGMHYIHTASHQLNVFLNRRN
jgi:hypothetical protein